MLRCTIELVPYGKEERKETIGLVEITNDSTGEGLIGNYVVSLKKNPPFEGSLKENWARGAFEDDLVINATVTGHHRTRRGVYDLLYRALKACGIDRRNP